MRTMDNEKVTVPGVLIISWYNLPLLVVWGICIGNITGLVESLLWTLVLYFLLVVVSAVVALVVYGKLFMSQVTMSADGIVEENRFRTKITAWDQIIQVGFMSDKNPKMLVMVKKSGSLRKERDVNLLFYLRNTGKIIAIPNEPGVAEKVQRCYGAVDFDLTADN